jgi:hypothetical protein
MPTYFYQSQATTYAASQTIVCKSSIDKSFLLEIVDDFKKILEFMPVGEFPSTLRSDINFEAKAEISETISLNLEGTVIFLYARMFNEPYPTNPTEEQRDKINSIWVGIGHPENIIPR